MCFNISYNKTHITYKAQNILVSFTSSYEGYVKYQTSQQISGNKIFLEMFQLKSSRIDLTASGVSLTVSLIKVFFSVSRSFNQSMEHQN